MLVERLGLTPDLARQLIVDMPPVVALDPRLLQLNMAGLSSMLAVPLPALVGLVSCSIGLLAVPADLLALHVEYLAQVRGWWWWGG